MLSLTLLGRAEFPADFALVEEFAETTLPADARTRDLGWMLHDIDYAQGRGSVPAAVTRTAGVKSNLFWDKTPNTLGVTAFEGEDGITAGQGARTHDEHTAFKTAQRSLIGETEDPELMALAGFCRTWQPIQFAGFPDALAILDQNTVFTLQDGSAIHTLPAAQASLKTESGVNEVMCLVTGQYGPLARLHPKIQGVMGAQSSGASLVSFNIDSAESNAKEQGDNAPTSEVAAFAYGTALNAMLARDSGHSMRHGDATMVFWASAKNPQAEVEVEDVLGAAFAMSKAAGNDDSAETLLRQHLVAIAQGSVPTGSAPDPASRIFILGLSPNAERLSVRFWHTDWLDTLAQRITQFRSEGAITPLPFIRGGAPRMPGPVALLYDRAALHDGKNIPPNLAGDLMRAVLTSQPYLATLLPTVIGRIPVEGDPDHARHGNIDGRRAALIPAFLIRNLKQEVPMALSESETDVAYLLGRLFGAYVYAERSYQERATSLRSKYMGAASATPARVFPVLMRGYEHNLASLRKAGGQRAGSGSRPTAPFPRSWATCPAVCCPRQAALIHAERLWAENQFTTERSILHERADAGRPKTRDGVRVLRAVHITSEERGLHGVADAVEMRGRVP